VKILNAVNERTRQRTCRELGRARTSARLRARLGSRASRDCLAAAWRARSRGRVPGAKRGALASRYRARSVDCLARLGSRAGAGGRRGQPQAGAHGMAGAPGAVLAQLVAWRGRGERAGREEREWGGRERLGERERAVEAAAAGNFQQARALQSARVWGNGPLVGRFSEVVFFILKCIFKELEKS
jgi:hypothetical protein